MWYAIVYNMAKPLHFGNLKRPRTRMHAAASPGSALRSRHRRFGLGAVIAAAVAGQACAQQLTLNVPPLGSCDPFTGWVTQAGGPQFKVRILSHG